MNRHSAIRIIADHPSDPTLRVLSRSFGCEHRSDVVLEKIWRHMKDGSSQAIEFAANYTNDNLKLPWEKFLELVSLPGETTEIFGDISEMANAEAAASEPAPSSDTEIDAEHIFQVAISYAQAHRPEYARAIAQALSVELGKDSVFCDSNYSTRMNTRRVDRKIEHIFESAPLCIVILSQDYRDSEWCQFEWEIIRDRQESDCQFVIRLDDVRMMGLSNSDGYLDARQHDIGSIISDILKRAKGEMRGLDF